MKTSRPLLLGALKAQCTTMMVRVLTQMRKAPINERKRVGLEEVQIGIDKLHIVFPSLVVEIDKAGETMKGVINDAKL